MRKIAVLTIALTFAAAGALADDTYASCYKSGIANYKARKYADAVKDLDKAVELAADNKAKAQAINYKA